MEHWRSRFVIVVGWGIALIGVFLLFAPGDWFPSFYAPRFMGVAAFFFIVLMALPRWLFRPSTHLQRISVEYLQIAITIGLVLSGLGELGLWQLYQYGFEYDKVVHVIMPALVTPALAATLYYRGWLLFRAKANSVFIVFLSGVLWEYAEFYNDRVFGTQLFGIYGADVFRDTALDLSCNALGIGLALVVLHFAHKKIFLSKIS